MGRSALAVAAVCVFHVVACGDDGGGSVKAFCASAQEFADSEEDFLNLDNPDYAARLEEDRDLINGLAESAPDEISDDAETAAGVFGEVIDSLADVDLTDEEAMLEAFAPFDVDNPELEAALENLDEFILTECGIDLDESG